MQKQFIFIEATVVNVEGYVKLKWLNLENQKYREEKGYLLQKSKSVWKL